MEPESGELTPGAQVDVKVHLVSTTVKVYDVHLVVDVDGVGDALRSIPIHAQCVVPDVRLALATVSTSACVV